ncbi:flagellar basal-body rod protein FlgB [Chitinivorax tropicus]|uniref:Flagellar basal body rod protein FlgB n=1 Tax=Chitinivorax tropicus TaxID=714531 RepID=A0A840MMQ5_9PROT|nr:flagellar basal body rod protein FlgB [Chitinivorax tropicus]MBB5018745.1 flagellar basal-body rod protein FlgB [Chitinivorax tropicus]
MLGKIDREFAFLEKAIKLRTFRQELIASNIANADTPGYKAKDIDFANALSGAVGNRGDLALSTTHRRHLGPAEGSAMGAQVLYRLEKQASIDGNTVDTDTELANFTDNAVRYQAELTFMNSRIRSLTSAMQTR